MKNKIIKLQKEIIDILEAKIYYLEQEKEELKNQIVKMQIESIEQSKKILIENREKIESEIKNV